MEITEFIDFNCHFYITNLTYYHVFTLKMFNFVEHYNVLSLMDI